MRTPRVSVSRKREKPEENELSGLSRDDQKKLLALVRLRGRAGKLSAKEFQELLHECLKNYIIQATKQSIIGQAIYGDPRAVINIVERLFYMMRSCDTQWGKELDERKSNALIDLSPLGVSFDFSDFMDNGSDSTN